MVRQKRHETGEFPVGKNSGNGVVAALSQWVQIRLQPQINGPGPVLMSGAVHPPSRRLATATPPVSPGLSGTAEPA